MKFCDPDHIFAFFGPEPKPATKTDDAEGSGLVSNVECRDVEIEFEVLVSWNGHFFTNSTDVPGLEGALTPGLLCYARLTSSRLGKTATSKSKN